MSNPKVSIIIAVYNTEKYLKESIGSVLKQSMKDFELIIVDDCSTDNSLKIIEELTAKDNRIRIIKNKKNRQAEYCRNKAIKIAKGKYIAIHDSDDICTKDRLKIQTEYLDKHPDIFLVAGSYEYIDESGRFMCREIFDYDHQKVASRLVVHNMIHNPTVMFRNDGQTYYREKVLYAGDRDLWMRLLSRSKKMVVLPDILLKYRVHPTSITMSKYRKQKMFSEKAIEWYYERKKFGRDSYDKFDPNTILSLKDNNIYNNILVEKRRIQMLLFKDRKKYRKELLVYWRNNGLRNWKRLPLSYVLSFIPEYVSGFFPIVFSNNYIKFKKWFKYYFLKWKSP